MISDFLEHLRRERYAAATVVISEKWLEHFLSRHPKPLARLRPADLTRYHKSLHWEPGPRGKLYSEHTANQAVGVLRSYFNWCVQHGHLRQSPAAHIVTRRLPPKKVRLLMSDQARKLLSLPDLGTPLGLRDRVALGLVIEAQASPGALSRLDVADFQPDTGAMLLKGRRRRIVSLEPGLQDDIERYLRLGRAGYAQPGEVALLLSRFGTRMGGPGFLALLNRYCRQAGLERPTFFL